MPASTSASLAPATVAVWNSASVIDHLLSTLVFVLFLVEFLLVKGATTSLFFVLMLFSLVDVLAGFSVSLRAASRDVNLR